MDRPQDFTGREICINDVIVYPVRRRSDMQLHPLRVQAVFRNPVGKWVIGGYDPRLRRQQMVNFYTLDRCVVVDWKG